MWDKIATNKKRPSPYSPFMYQRGHISLSFFGSPFYPPVTRDGGNSACVIGKWSVPGKVYVRQRCTANQCASSLYSTVFPGLHTFVKNGQPATSDGFAPMSEQPPKDNYKPHFLFLFLHYPSLDRCLSTHVHEDRRRSHL